MKGLLVNVGTSEETDETVPRGSGHIETSRADK